MWGYIDMASTIVVYNGYTLPQLSGKFSFVESYKTFSLTAEFIVAGTSESLFVTACTAAETALSVWNGDLTLTMGATSQYSFSHDSNTGFLAQPTLSIVPNKLHTGRSRMYRLSIKGQLPARDSGYNYRQSGNISLSQDIKGRKTLKINGNYTAGGAASAVTNYETYGIAWVEDIAAGFGTYEEQHRDYKYEQENKSCSFVFVYKEKLTLAVTYNGYSIPGNYNNFTFREGYETLSMSFDFEVNTSAASAAEVALRIKNKALVVSFGGSAAYSYSHSANTGFLAKPMLSKISDKTHVDTKRYYKFTLNCQLPANDSGYGYRQDAKITRSQTGSRRKILTFTGVYTAGRSKSATSNYASGITAFVATWISAFGGSYEKVTENVSPEMENKTCTFSLTYQELLTKDTSSKLDEAKIVGADCTYSVNVPNIIGTSSSSLSQVPLIQVNLSYTTMIDNTLLSDDTEIADLYLDTVRPWLMQHSYDILGLDTFGVGSKKYVIQSENYALNPHEFSVSGGLVFWALSSKTQVIELDETIGEINDEGIAYQKLYDGKPNTYNLWYIGAESKKTRTIRVKKIGSPPAIPLKLGSPWVRLRSSITHRATRHGVGSGSVGSQNTAVWVYDYTFTEEYLLSIGGSFSGGTGYVYTEPNASFEGGADE